MHPQQFFKSKDIKPETGKCFVIMPFAKGFTKIYKTIREAVEGSELNFECKRADNIVVGGYVMDSVYEGIAEAEFVIADLTGNNPNVFYELGITHMQKSVEKVIILIQEEQAVPFDLNAFRHIKYKPTTAGAKSLQAALVTAIKEVADVLIVSNAGAYPVYRFNVEQRNTYKFPKLLGSGKSGTLYDFEIFGEYVGKDFARLKLSVRRYPGGDSQPVVAYSNDIRVDVGKIRLVPKIPWRLVLISTSGDTATFNLEHKSQKVSPPNSFAVASTASAPAKKPAQKSGVLSERAGS